MKKFLSALMCLAMLTSMVVCGASAEEVITLKVMSGIQMESEAPLERAMADAYMAANPNIKIELIPQKVVDVPTVITAMNSSGNLPDIFPMPTQFTVQAKVMGVAADVREYMSDEFYNSLTPAAIEGVMTDGIMMQVPWTTQPQVLIYRSDWLADAGMDKIETMDDFVAAAKAFTKPEEGVYGFAMVGVQNGSGQGRYLQFVNSFGVREVYQDENGEWKSDLTTDAYRDCLTFFTNLDLVEGVVGPGSTETGYPEACNLMATERAGLFITGSNGIGVILKQNPELAGKLATCPTPKQVQNCSQVAVGGYAVSAHTPYKAEAVKYLEFLASPENSVAYAKATGRLPVTTTAAADPAFQAPEFKGCIEAINVAIPQPAYEGYSEIWDIMGESYNSVLSGVSVDDAMKQVEKRVAEVLAKY